jgi:type I restriction enzyme M protein
MASELEPLALTCPIRGTLKPKKKKSADLSATEERHRIDAIRYLLHHGYDPKKIKIEAVVAKFGHGGKNSFRCDLAVLDIDAAMLDMSAPDSVDTLLKHAVLLGEVKRDGAKAAYVEQTQVKPLLNFASRKDTIGFYWDGVNARVFWKEDDGGKTEIKSGPLALLPKPGKAIKAKGLNYKALMPPTSLQDVFSRLEDVLHAASVPLEQRYEVLLQFILAKIFDEHQGESKPNHDLQFQDFESIGMSAKQAAIDLNNVLAGAVSYYGKHLPRSIEDTFQIPDDVLSHCGQILAPHLVTAANKEVIQTFYMKFAKDLYRWDLAQYFTPPTVTDFIVEVLNPGAGETVKDPACGSADFLVASFHRSRARGIKNSADANFGTDDDQNAVQIAVLNMLLNGDGKSNIRKEDALMAVAHDIERLEKEKKFKPVLYHAVVCNPPFGQKIVERRREVLRWFDLGHVWKSNDATKRLEKEEEILASQEKGILFAEVCVRQCRPGGRIAIILPNGYLGNRSEKYVVLREWLLRHCRIVSICGFPRFTFKTSGADVSASVVYLERRAEPLADSRSDKKYMFNAELIENVGWSVGDKNALPIYERLETDGSFIVDADGRKRIKSDFRACLDDIRSSPVIAHYPWLTKDLGLAPHGAKPLGWAVPIKGVVEDPARTLDPKRHSRKYASLLTEIRKVKFLPLTDIVDIMPEGQNAAGIAIKKKDDGVYEYIDIDSIGAGEYRSTSMRGWQLPARAKHCVEPLDIFVGSIWSSVTKWCLISASVGKNTWATNGCHRLRLKDHMSDKLLDLCAFLCSEAYATQMRALARGSDGLAEIHTTDLGLVLVPLVEDPKRRKELAPFVNALKKGVPSLKHTVSLLQAHDDVFPTPRPRPHHSALV